MEITQAKLKELLDYNSETGMFRWIAGARPGKIAGTKHCRGYWQIQLDKKTYLAHRLAWLYVYGKFPNLTDHINGTKLDNRICNLRECNDQQNRFNCGVGKNNTTGLKGVTFMKDRIKHKWKAQIDINGKQIFLGTFATAELASEAFVAKAKELHGEFYCER